MISGEVLVSVTWDYHIAQNHPFVDGNKRTAFSSALTFLELNGYAVMGGEAELEAATRNIIPAQDRNTFNCNLL